MPKCSKSIYKIIFQTVSFYITRYYSFILLSMYLGEPLHYTLSVKYTCNKLPESAQINVGFSANGNSLCLYHKKLKIGHLPW